MEIWNPRHHQTLGFLHGDALPGLYMQLLLVCGSFWPGFVLSKWNAGLIGLRSGDWLGPCRIFHFFAKIERKKKKKSLVALALVFFFFHLYRETPSNQLCHICLNLSRRCISIHLTIHSAASVFCHIISKHKWPSANGSHPCPCHGTASTMFYRGWCALDRKLFLFFSTLYSSHYSVTGWSSCLSQSKRAHISLAQKKTWTERPTNKQQLKVKAWQSITMEETQCLVVFMGSRLQAVGACKGFLTKYWEVLWFMFNCLINLEPLKWGVFV